MSITTAEPPLRVPITVASKKGVSWLNETAAHRRVLLTRHNRVNSVVDSAERLDETARVVQTARREVVEAFSDLASARTTGLSLSEVCAELGLDEARVRARARELADGQR